MTFIQYAGISQRIRILQFRFRDDKGHNFATFCAILVKIGAVTSEITRKMHGKAQRIARSALQCRPLASTCEKYLLK